MPLSCSAWLLPVMSRVGVQDRAVVPIPFEQAEKRHQVCSWGYEPHLIPKVDCEVDVWEVPPMHLGQLVEVQQYAQHLDKGAII